MDKIDEILKGLERGNKKADLSVFDEFLDKPDFASIHKAAVTDLDNEPERPPLAISIGINPHEYNGNRYPLRFGTFGGISLIKGHEKVRKSFAKSLLLACAIGGKADNYCELIRGHDLWDKYIFDIDTEQGEHDVWLNATRIPKMVGKKPENYVSVQLRRYNHNERLGYLEWLFRESPYREKLGVVCLDGYVDFVKDFNSQQESTEFTQKLMTYASDGHCHITGILHLNPNMTKARGHLGTILQQKCETVVRIEDQGDYSAFMCERARGRRFEDFNFTVNPQTWLPEMIDGHDSPFS